MYDWVLLQDTLFLDGGPHLLDDLFPVLGDRLSPLFLCRFSEVGNRGALFWAHQSMAHGVLRRHVHMLMALFARATHDRRVPHPPPRGTQTETGSRQRRRTRSPDSTTATQDSSSSVTTGRVDPPGSQGYGRHARRTTTPD